LQFSKVFIALLTEALSDSGISKQTLLKKISHDLFFGVCRKLISSEPLWKTMVD
jgi:hypothetical protein